jgi:hypothetical protein
MTRVVLELPPDEAEALAQLVKRTGVDDCRQRASRYDGGLEADLMWSAVQKLQRALAETGFAPR